MMNLKNFHNYVNVKYYTHKYIANIHPFFQCNKGKIPRVYGMMQAYSID